VTAAPARRDAITGRPNRIRLAAAALLALLALLTAVEAPWTERLQAAWFDAHQALVPRQVKTLAVTIVEIDQRSLAALGQWPWPRSWLARLIEAINQAHPAAIGLDLLMSEADALSPERLLAQDPALAAALRGRQSHDALLGQALAAAPAVLGLAGTPEPGPSILRAPPVTLRSLRANGDAAPAVTRYAGALTSIESLNRQARGWGLISVDTPRGVVRRMPLVASINGTLVPSLAVEMLRVASGAPALQLTTSGPSATAVSVAGLQVPTEADGEVRVYFSPRRADRFVSAVDVLEGRVDPVQLQRQLVLIGPTAIGLGDFQDTPIGERMPDSEIHAQLIENLLDGTLLVRPAWAPRAEALLLLVLGAALLWFTPRSKPLHAALMAMVLVALPALGAFALFRTTRLLLDAATPGLYLLLLFVTLLVLTLAESMRQRRSLERIVQAQREQAARIAGELEAAQRIQMGSLPRMDLLAGDRRIELHATLTPAREVGGDLYDFFMLDENRLFLLIGDVAGKGLSASIFMAVSKALYKGAMMRAPEADIGEIMTAANIEVSRDNAQMLFVTAFAAILDLDSGELDYCNAGHDNPYRLPPGPAPLMRIGDGDGPPLCALSDFAYRSARVRLQPGEMLCLMTDGVVEAQNAAGELYGAARLQRILSAQREAAAGAHAIVDALHADVRRFSGDAEAADDLTILALRWRGPGAGTTAARGR
jgi:adenylate cyclase